MSLIQKQSAQISLNKKNIIKSNLKSIFELYELSCWKESKLLGCFYLLPDQEVKSPYKMQR